MNPTISVRKNGVVIGDWILKLVEKQLTHLFRTIELEGQIIVTCREKLDAREQKHLEERRGKIFLAGASSTDKCVFIIFQAQGKETAYKYNCRATKVPHRELYEIFSRILTGADQVIKVDEKQQLAVPAHVVQKPSNIEQSHDNPPANATLIQDSVGQVLVEKPSLTGAGSDESTPENNRGFIKDFERVASFLKMLKDKIEGDIVSTETVREELASFTGCSNKASISQILRKFVQRGYFKEVEGGFAIVDEMYQKVSSQASSEPKNTPKIHRVEKGKKTILSSIGFDMNLGVVQDELVRLVREREVCNKSLSSRRDRIQKITNEMRELQAKRNQEESLLQREDAVLTEINNAIGSFEGIMSDLADKLRGIHVPK